MYQFYGVNIFEGCLNSPFKLFKACESHFTLSSLPHAVVKSRRVYGSKHSQAKSVVLASNLNEPTKIHNRKYLNDVKCESSNPVEPLETIFGKVNFITIFAVLTP